MSQLTLIWLGQENLDEPRARNASRRLEEVAKAKAGRRKMRNQLVIAKNEKRIEADFSSVPSTSPASSEAQYHGNRIYALVEHSKS